MQCDVQNKWNDLLGDTDPLYRPDEEEGAKNKMSGNTVTVDMTGDRDKDSAMDFWPVYSIDASIAVDSDKIST